VKHKTGFFFSVMVFALAAVACSSSLLPAQTAPLPATFTPDGLLAQTLSATPAATATPLPPSETPTSTKTQFPTITPLPSDTPIPSVTPLGAGPTPTPQYACELIDKYPDNWTVYKPREKFEARWTVKNTGTLPLQPPHVAVEYISGVKMHIFKDKQDLTTGADPDKLLLLIVDMIAPKAKGDYVAVWGLVETRTGNVFCSFTTKIVVK
jgi:hypothetical protein